MAEQYQSSPAPADTLGEDLGWFPPGKQGHMRDLFEDAYRRSHSEGSLPTTLFDPPSKAEIRVSDHRVELEVARHGWLGVDAAATRVEEWRQHALRQGERRENSNRVVLSLFDHTGQWSQPWADAGYDTYRFDIQDDPENGDINKFSVEHLIDTWGDFDGREIFAVLAAVPCTEFSGSGARHWAAKDADGRTAAAIHLARQTLSTIEYFRPSVWAIENPKGRIQRMAGLPPHRFSFDPNHFGEPYTKRTLLFGRFNGDLPVAPVVASEGSKMHRLYGGNTARTKNARSETPLGFSYSFFMANNAVDHPLQSLAWRFDRLPKSALEMALNAGASQEDIAQAVADAYYMDLDDEAAVSALEELADGAQPEFG